MTLTIGGVTHSVEAASAVYVNAIASLSVTFSDTGPPLAGAGASAGFLTGPGTYTVSTGAGNRGEDTWAAFNSGTLVITVLDVPDRLRPAAPGPGRGGGRCGGPR